MPFTYKSKHCICCHKLLDAIENSANKTTSTFEIYYLAKSNVNLSSDNAMSASKTNTSKQSTTNIQTTVNNCSNADRHSVTVTGKLNVSAHTHTVCEK